MRHKEQREAYKEQTEEINAGVDEPKLELSQSKNIIDNKKQ